MGPLVHVPKRGDLIYKEECVLCFKTAESKIWCCGTCFEGFCQEHYKLHTEKIPTHEQFLIVHKTQKKQQEGESSDLSSQNKMVKLEIPAQKAPEFDYFYSVEGSGAELFNFTALIDSVSCSSVAFASSSDSWSEPSAQACEHSLCLVQAEESAMTGKDLNTCSKCDLKSNLWKCMTCGTLSCGRRQFDGSGGNGHAMEHFKESQHALALKLGTIAVKSDGVEGDIYCYQCDDFVVDPDLNSHLIRLGIDPDTTRKTEKSTAELNLDINLTHTYAMTDSSGTELKELSGPWLRGFTNLGNSCYLASVMQSLRSLDKESFLAADHDYVSCSSKKASECLSCQLKKLYNGLSSSQGVLRPWMFKKVAAGSNSEFQSGRQQDATEFLSHLLENSFKRDPKLVKLTDNFRLQLEETIKCGQCGNERCSVTSESCLILTTPESSDSCSLQDLFEMRFAPESVDWKCDQCSSSSSSGSVSKTTKLVSLPKYLVLVANRLKMKNWVPEKAECHIEGMDCELDLQSFCGEQSEKLSANARGPVADPVLLGELLLMGMEEEPARRALIKCNNSSIDAAMTIIFEGGSSEESPNAISSESVDTLMAAGFSESKARAALEATNGDLERAFDWIFSHIEEDEKINVSVDFGSNYRLNSFITHKGTSIFCGHYVCHLRAQGTDDWVLYNDEKVAEAAMDDSFPIKDAYIYIYKQKEE